MCDAFGLQGYILRLGNVVGTKLTYGVIFDFMRKLKSAPKKLTVLADGKQTKLCKVDLVTEAMFLLDKSEYASRSTHWLNAPAVRFL